MMGRHLASVGPAKVKGGLPVQNTSARVFPFSSVPLRL